MSDELYMRFYDEGGTYVACVIGVGPPLMNRPGEIIFMMGRSYRIIGPVMDEEVDGETVPVVDIQTVAWH